jgi:hypothetical protein
MINLDILSVVLLASIAWSAIWTGLMVTVIVGLKVQAYWAAKKMLSRSLQTIPLEALLGGSGGGGRPGATTSKSAVQSPAGSGFGKYL